jgi:hypothetical protein
MDAREYFETVVLPIFKRLVNEPEALELQIAATIIVFHTADYISKTKGLSLHDVRATIMDHEPDFEAVYAAAIANKHKIVGRNPAQYIGLTAPQQNIPDYVTHNGEYVTIDGSRITCGKVPHFVLQDGRELPVINILQRIIDVLDQKTQPD